MDEETADFDEAGELEVIEETPAYEAKFVGQRHDVRRRIEEMLERKRLREEFGDMDDF